MPSSNSRRHRGSHGGAGLWLRRNVWLVAAATFVVLYCAFMVRTTMWVRTFGVEREQHQAMAKASDHEAMDARKEMGALRGENARKEAEGQAEEAVENGREQLDKGEGEQEAVGRRRPTTRTLTRRRVHTY